MEKQYICFDTGLGCLAAVLGFAAASVSIVLIFPYISASPWLFLVATLALLLVFMWLPFRIDARTKMRLRAKTSVPEPSVSNAPGDPNAASDQKDDDFVAF